MGYLLGVDLGTTYTSAAVIEDQEPKIFSLGDHEFFVPSVLVLDRHTEVIVASRPNVVRDVAGKHCPRVQTPPG